MLLLLLAASEFAQLVTLRIAAAPDDAILVMLFAVALDFLFVWAVLVVFERRQRFWQTMSAFLGADVVLNTISALLVAWNQSLQAARGCDDRARGAVLQLLQVWSVDIAAFVLSRAIDRHYALGVVIMLGYVLLVVERSARTSAVPTEPPNARSHPRHLRHVHGRHRGDREGRRPRRLRAPIKTSTRR